MPPDLNQMKMNPLISSFLQFQIVSYRFKKSVYSKVKKKGKKKSKKNHFLRSFFLAIIIITGKPTRSFSPIGCYIR